jgi:hypothetical protein
MITSRTIAATLQNFAVSLIVIYLFDFFSRWRLRRSHVHGRLLGADKFYAGKF